MVKYGVDQPKLDESNADLVADENGRLHYRQYNDAEGGYHESSLSFLENISTRIQDAYHTIVVDRLARMNRSIKDATIGQIESSIEKFGDLIVDLMRGRKRYKKTFESEESSVLPEEGSITPTTGLSVAERFTAETLSRFGRRSTEIVAGMDPVTVNITTQRYLDTVRAKNAAAQKPK